MKLSPAHLKEIKKCKDNFLHFCKYLKIVDKRGKLITFKPLPAQVMIVDELESNPLLAILKARQLGSSTLIAAYYLHKALLNTNHKVAVVAHTLEAVRNIFSIYQTYYDNLPAFLKFDTKNDNANELKFAHGSRVKVGTPNSFRGSTYQSIHASEVAFWQNPEDDVAALFQVAGENPTIIMETTPNGLNYFYNFWNANKGYSKLFLGWMLDPSYVDKKKPKGGFSEAELQLIGQVKEELTTKQKNWLANTLRSKCAGNIQTFKQEYAFSSIDCFITSGERVFDITFPDATVTDGYIQYEAPVRFQPYLMGVDAASGSPNGDFSSFVVLTRDENPKVVAVHYAREDSITFADRVIEIAKRYNAFVVVESASEGYSVINNLKREEYPHMYRRLIKDKTGSELTEKLGYSTNVKTRALLMNYLTELINVKKITIPDERIQAEINTFVFRKGRMEHDIGQHDDALFAMALAWAGYEQADYIVREQKNIKPSNMSEMLSWEAAHGLNYNQFNEPEDEYSFTTIQDLL